MLFATAGEQTERQANAEVRLGAINILDQYNLFRNFPKVRNNAWSESEITG